MADITAIVLTRNEEKNIERCLQSVKGLCRRMVVVDCGSTDRTVPLAEQNGAEVFQHEFEYYARQFNWGLDNCRIDTKWVIRLDADEQFPPELCAEIEREMEAHDSDDVNGMTLEATYFFLGRALTHGSKKRKLMVFKNGIGRIEDRRRDAHTVLSEGRSISLQHNFLHYDFKDLDNFIARYNWYATREAMDYMDLKQGKREAATDDPEIERIRRLKSGIYYRFPKFLRAWLWFHVNYLFRGGFLDGVPGFIYHVLSSFWYRFVVDAKIYEYEHGKPFDELKAFQ
ncbi:MAG: glycosyltransferase family 2 protein [Clostridia bacterium]|nr:glycosyltransferase family 2 protein [Clostridia bacterium]